MSLDVSPDGKEIVFDLLGDLYTMPIAGGEAKALTSGIAWDMQPRYSPDGKWIAFTCDRAGGDNIWVMRPRRQEPAAGHEGVLPPAQQPRVVARLAVHRRAQALHRHALARRGRDLALPPHGRRGPPDDQERRPSRRTPASPRSRPTAATSTTARTPRPARSSSTTRIPNGQIYVIKRLDRQTGRLIDFVTGPGRLDPPDAVARRQVARVRPPRPLQVDALRQGPRVRRRAPDLGRPRARHAGDVGDPRRLSRRWRGRRTASSIVLWAGGQDPPRRRRDEAGRRRSRST